ncbi:MAG: hypothetical protein QOG15_2394 [Solirubrobacteraceae bacterium]|jgi:hypothetical protein|nr:hypothetical protein [Solirubrobacteraceae bacterium]
MSNARVFINYRRSDSAGWARQLHGDLGRHFASERIFRDVAIEPGVDFVDHIERVMDACEVCIVVIGPRWLSATNPDGRRRLDDPTDLVRLEIERALQRPDVEVIPVLVDGAAMPAERDLPLGLQPLARRNACGLTDARWDYDVEVVCRRLRTVLGEDTGARLAATAATTAAAPSSQRPGAADPTRAALGAAVTIGVALVAALVAAAVSNPLADKGATDTERLVAYAIERAAIWAIIGGVVAWALAAAFGGAVMPLGRAIAGAVAGAIGGAAGGAAFIALKDMSNASPSDWVLVFVLLGLPALVLAPGLARAAGARAGECTLAALAGVAVAALLHSGDSRAFLITAHAVIIVTAVVAAIAVSPQITRRRQAADSGGSYAARSSTSS